MRNPSETRRNRRNEIIAGVGILAVGAGAIGALVHQNGEMQRVQGELADTRNTATQAAAQATLNRGLTAEAILRDLTTTPNALTPVGTPSPELTAAAAPTGTPTAHSSEITSALEEYQARLNQAPESPSLDGEVSVSPEGEVAADEFVTYLTHLYAEYTSLSTEEQEQLLQQYPILHIVLPASEQEAMKTNQPVKTLADLQTGLFRVLINPERNAHFLTASNQWRALLSDLPESLQKPGIEGDQFAVNLSQITPETLITTVEQDMYLHAYVEGDRILPAVLAQAYAIVKHANTELNLNLTDAQVLQNASSVATTWLNRFYTVNEDLQGESRTRIIYQVTQDQSFGAAARLPEIVDATSYQFQMSPDLNGTGADNERSGQRVETVCIALEELQESHATQATNLKLGADTEYSLLQAVDGEKLRALLAAGNSLAAALIESSVTVPTHVTAEEMNFPNTNYEVQGLVQGENVSLVWIMVNGCLTPMQVGDDGTYTPVPTVPTHPYMSATSRVSLTPQLTPIYTPTQSHTPIVTVPGVTETAPAATDTAPAPTDTVPAPTDTAPAPTDTAPAPTKTDMPPTVTNTIPAATATPLPSNEPITAPTLPAQPTDAATSTLMAPATGTFTPVPPMQPTPDDKGPTPTPGV